VPSKLADALLKHRRASETIDLLAGEMAERWEGAPNKLPIVGGYEPDDAAVIYKVANTFTPTGAWPFLVSEAIHHLRSALDVAWWQAVVSYSGQPTEEKARKIHFPVLWPGGKWPSNHQSLVGPAVATVVRNHQPSPSSTLRDFHPLRSLNYMWNLDKHRQLPVLSHVELIGTFEVLPSAGNYVDCEPDGGYAPVPVPAAERISDVDDVLYRIATEISIIAPAGSEPPAPQIPRDRAIDLGSLESDP
jgi:hypothetical protein